MEMEMESGTDERDYDVEETIFVAVGTSVEKSKQTLFWALQSFAGKKICLLHVHQPTNVVSLVDRKPAAGELKEDMVEAVQELERKKRHDVLDQYHLMLAEKGVKADSVWIEMDNIEMGIVEIIARCNIKWLVMGAAADKHYSKKLVELKSRKAISVGRNAADNCHIWFVCKGLLIYTRISLEVLDHCIDYSRDSHRNVSVEAETSFLLECRADKSEGEIILPLLLLNSDLITEQSQQLIPESVTQISRNPDGEEDGDDLDTILGRFNDQCALNSGQSTDVMLSPSKSVLLLTDEGEKTRSPRTENNWNRLEHVITNAEELKLVAFEERAKRWKEEDDAMEAKCKAKALETLCVKEMKIRKQSEEALAREKKELERMKNERDETLKEIQMVQEQKAVLERQITESQNMVKELEEKFISAVELLISFKEKRDVARVEYENAVREVKKLRNLAKRKAAGFSRSEILEFSFVEINKATHCFDPSWKMGEGRYGSTYKGLLRHVHVAIKMLPTYGSQSQEDFLKGVEILSRIRHPNLVTVIGTCPESRSIAYEYVRNGSLEDCLNCEGKTSPLSWEIRTRIAIEICSALIFLHSNKPCIIHGNLKPSNVLLDANFVSKVSDFGIYYLIPQGSHMGSYNTNNSNTNSNIVPVDPEYLETGIMTPESDVYSFGIILLRLLTGRPTFGIVKDVRCAVEKEDFKAMLDCSAGDWLLEQAEQLAKLALRCCEKKRSDRPDLVSEIWSVFEPLGDLGTRSASRLEPKEWRQTPSHFICPIFQEVMKNPQIAADGFTYDADAIKGWLHSGHDTSPMTNLKLEHCNLIPNHALDHAIQEWRQHC